MPVSSEKPRAQKGMNCPTLGKDMSTVCHKCPLWIKIAGKHPQSEDILESWDCSWALLPIMLIENAQMQRHTGAAVESFRNETLNSNERTMQVMARAVQVAGAQMANAHKETAGKLTTALTAIAAANAVLQSPAARKQIANETDN